MSPTPQEVIDSVFAAGPGEPAFFWVVIGVVAAVLTAGMGVVSIVDMISRLSSVPVGAQDDSPTNFGGPRSQYGDAIPFVFGTVQIRSPICLWHGGLELSSPFPWIDPEDRLQYASTIDLLLCERVLVDGVQHGSIRLRKIWAGTNLLWNGSHFAFDDAPVTSSGNLLAMDPSVDDSLVPGGGFVGSDGMDHAGLNGWWFGGIVAETRKVTYPSSNPSFVPEDWHGNVLGGVEKVANSGVWARYLGMEKIRFYAGSGAETQDPLGFYIFGPDWNTETQFIYPSYHKFSRLVFERFYWGPEPQIPDISAEVTVTCPAPEIGDVTGIMTNGLDVNPISVLYTLLTHPDFCGGLKLPGVDTTSFSEARQIANDEGLGMSYRLQSPTKARELVDTILKHVDGFLFLDPESGLIKVKLARLVQTQLPRFNESHVLSIDDISKTTWEATFSQARVTFEMRGAAGNQMGAKNIAVAKDPGLAANSGLVETIDETLATVYDPIVANTIAARLLSAANTPLFKVQLRMSRAVSTAGPSTSAMGLRPGDMFILDYAPLGLTNLRLRVVKVDLGSLESNAVQVTTIQDVYQGRAIIAPPGQPDRYTIVDPPIEVEIETYRMFTAPYYIARDGLGPDARRVLTTAPLYQVDEDTEGKQFAVNYDRFMMLAKAPYAGATSFQWTLQDGDGVLVHSATVPYTECGQLTAGISAPTINSDGTLASMIIEGLTVDGASLLTSSPDKLLLINDEFFLVSGANATVSEDGTSVTIAPLLRQLLDSPEQSSHSIGDTVWIFDAGRTGWFDARLSPPLQSSVEEYWDFFVEEPTNGYFNDFQTLGAAHTLRIRNLDASKLNVETDDTVVLQDRANRALPIRQVDNATATVSLDAAETSFEFDFEQLTFVPRLFQQREISLLPDNYGTSFNPLLPKEQQTSDVGSAECISGILTDAQEEDWHHVVKLECWYEYNGGPLSGQIISELGAAYPKAGPGSNTITFGAAAESATRLITCYLRVCYAPYLLGDAGYVPIRRSVARTYRITLNRT